MFSLNTLTSINAHAAIVREDTGRKARGLKPLNAAARAVRNAQAEATPGKLKPVGSRKVTLQGRVVEV